MRRAVGAARGRRGSAARARRRAVGAARAPRRSAACASATAPAGAPRRSARRASGSCATPPSRTTAGTPAAAASARCSARRTSRRWPCAAPRKRPPLADPDAVLGRRARPARALVRAGDRQVPRAGHARQPAGVQRDRTLSHRATSSAASFEGAAALPAEQLSELRGVAAHAAARPARSAASTSMPPATAAGVRVEYENVFALGPLCGVSDPDAVLAASARCDELGIDTISAGGTIAFAMECAERGLIDAPWLRFGDGAALLRALDEIGARRGRLGPLLAEGSRRAAAAGRRRLGGLRPAREGARAAGLRAAHAAGDGARPGGQRARRRPQPLGRVRGRPRPASSTASPAASRTSLPRSRPRTARRSWTR